MIKARYNHSSTLLSNGNVIIFGGNNIAKTNIATELNLLFNQLNGGNN